MPAAWAESSIFCDEPVPQSASQIDRMQQFAAIVRRQLEHPTGAASPPLALPLALISRSGMNLELLGQRYSHSGWALRDGQGPPDAAAWEVRQLYFACQEQRPRLFDQGLSAFVQGTNDPDLGFVSLVWLPPEASARVARRVADKATALALLGDVYSANAYPFSVRYQNCNQWTLEMLAPEPAASPNASPALPDRSLAQSWLQAQHYQPSEIHLHFPPLLWLGNLSPWLHTNDHPDSDLDQAQFSLSLPESLENFVRQQWPQAQRLELCHNATQVVIHPGWSALSADCQPGPGDTVLALQLAG